MDGDVATLIREASNSSSTIFQDMLATMRRDAASIRRFYDVDGAVRLGRFMQTFEAQCGHTPMWRDTAHMPVLLGVIQKTPSPIVRAVLSPWARSLAVAIPADDRRTARAFVNYLTGYGQLFAGGLGDSREETLKAALKGATEAPNACVSQSLTRWSIDAVQRESGLCTRGIRDAFVTLAVAPDRTDAIIRAAFAMAAEISTDPTFGKLSPSPDRFPATEEEYSRTLRGECVP